MGLKEGNHLTLFTLVTYGDRAHVKGWGWREAAIGCCVSVGRQWWLGQSGDCKDVENEPILLMT